MLHIDLETFSRIDLPTEGVYNYAMDPSTGVHCLCYAIDDGPVHMWVPGTPEPAELITAIAEGEPLAAHNAQFERLLFEYVLCNDHNFPVPKPDQWRCTAYIARCNNLPGALDKLARCLHLPVQKQARGRQLIRMLCVPQADGEFHSTPKLLAELYDYCADDVRVERAAMRIMREPTDTEWEDYFVTEEINDRGVMVDTDLANAAQAYATEEHDEMLRRIVEATGGEVTKVRGEGLKGWVVERLTEEQLQLVHKYKGGEKMISLDREGRARLLGCDDLLPAVRVVVECSDAVQKSSVGKFKAMALRADPDDKRVRGAFLPNGGSQTGRFSSKGCQVHNFPRQSMDDPEQVRLDLVDNILAEDIVDWWGESIMDTLSRMLRPTLVAAPGHEFLVSDWSAIEGRVAPWLSDNRDGEAKLDVFREGQDPYIIAAEAIYGPGVDKDQRQVGKVAELAFQFGGGARAYVGMASGFGLTIAVERAEFIKNRWRYANPWAKRLWDSCEAAARYAVNDPGGVYRTGRLEYFAAEGILAGGTTLFCRLPCGRLLTYPDCRVEMKETPWGDLKPSLSALRAAWTPKVGEKEWPRAGLWGGLLVENATQATAASLLRYALRRVREAGLSAVMHIHDEVVLETRFSHLARETPVLHEIMNTPPDWAGGLPLTADVDAMPKFGKS